MSRSLFSVTHPGTSTRRDSVVVGLAAMALAAAGISIRLDAQGGVDAARCRISGTVKSGGVPLPGVSLLVVRDGQTAVTSSTATDGTWDVTLAPGTYRLTAELTGFDRLERDLPLTLDSCTQTVDLQLAVTPRQPRTVVNSAGPTIPLPPRPRSGDQPRFDRLTVQRSAGVDAQANDLGQTSALNLPAGFSTDAPSDAIAINGSGANTDRGQLNDRRDALERGAFNLTFGDDLPFAFGGAQAGGFGPPGAGGRAGGPIDGGGGGFGGPPSGGFGGPGGPGRGGFLLGRGGQQRYSATTSYTVAGSALDSAPYSLRPDSATSTPNYLRQSVDFTAGGPLKIPGVYDGTRRTNLTLSYAAIRGDNLFDQYATVPSDALRAGDFSSIATTLIDPQTGQAFAGNQIPQDRIDPTARALLQYLPASNLNGSGRNFRYTSTAGTTQDTMNLRLTHNFTPPAQGQAGGGRGGPAAARGGAGGGRGFGPGRGGNPLNTTATLNAQVQYRRNDNERLNVFPSLGGQADGGTLAVPLTLNLTHRGVLHSVTANYSRTISNTVNRYANVLDVAGISGIAGAATDPFDWGVPNLSFSSLSSLNDLAPSRRTDTRVTLGYSWSHWFGKRRLRLGGDARRDWSSNQTDSNARGSFVFTGLYSGNDFADFLLGAPQQASVQYGPGTVRLRSRSASLYAEHEWWFGYFTFNTGVRYEFTSPFTDANGEMVNLDVASDFSAVEPVLSGGTGTYSGAFPKALIHSDLNNVLPRVGMAWQPAQGTTVRVGYGASINSGSYATIARQLASQPPFAVTNTVIGTADAPLALATALTTTSSSTTNNYGVAKDYQLGRVQTWNVDVSRDLTWTLTASAGYTYARGSSLDLVRAPNRGPDGLRISGVQSFLWQTSESSSRLHSAVFRLRKRPVRGIGGNISYTLAKSMDDASTIGGGSTVVAQDDQNLAAEWGRSSFDRRHQFAGSMNLELPFGPNRRWLNGGGVWAMLLEAWTANVNVTLQSGTPLTARVLSDSSDVARGTNGTLRANYNGDPIQLENPTIDRFFNTAAFSVPASGTFGNSARNIITGPGNKDVTAQFTRDVRLGGTRAVSIQLRATNLLNQVNYGAVDTVVNSSTFGQVTSVRSMRSMQVNIRFRY